MMERAPTPQHKEFSDDNDNPLPSTSRRERKKLKQNDALVSAALALFIERGFDDVNIEEIANEADVATSTLYNYFPTKQSLLLGVAKKFMSEVTAEFDAGAGQPASNVVDALMDQARLVWGPPLSPGEKRLWRHIRAASFLTETPEAGSFESNRQGYADITYRLLVALRDRNLIAPSADLTVLAAAIYAIRLHGFSRYVTIDEMTLEEALAEVRRQIEVIIVTWVLPDST